ncbi:unnamed protein product [Callosobruchus maculatus]|uniref:Uncharacterized protein n=1 Tax=Callosobruchus maculatus TaxID=64391 RepID=A0A653DD44_CALMS|nr:unnamed protein product [Callosobruchus maculatus]
MVVWGSYSIPGNRIPTKTPQTKSSKPHIVSVAAVITEQEEDVVQRDAFVKIVPPCSWIQACCSIFIMVDSQKCL